MIFFVSNLFIPTQFYGLSLELMSSPNTPISYADELQEELQRLKCTCGPLQWREGEDRYYCFCKYIRLHGLSTDRKRSIDRSRSAEAHQPASDDDEAQPASPTSVIAPGSIDGPPIPSILPGSKTVACPQIAAGGRFILSLRAMRGLTRSGLNKSTSQSEIERRINEVIGVDPSPFDICINGQWLHYEMKAIALH